MYVSHLPEGPTLFFKMNSVQLRKEIKVCVKVVSFPSVTDKRKKENIYRLYFNLRLLTGCFILVGSGMFGATFNLVSRVGLS